MCTFSGPHTFVTSVLNGMRPGNEASNFLLLGLVRAQIVEVYYLWHRVFLLPCVPRPISSLHEKRSGYDASVVHLIFGGLTASLMPRPRPSRGGKGVWLQYDILLDPCSDIAVWHVK